MTKKVTSSKQWTHITKSGLFFNATITKAYEDGYCDVIFEDEKKASRLGPDKIQERTSEDTLSAIAVPTSEISSKKNKPRKVTYVPLKEMKRENKRKETKDPSAYVDKSEQLGIKEHEGIQHNIRLIIFKERISCGVPYVIRR